LDVTGAVGVTATVGVIVGAGAAGVSTEFTATGAVLGCLTATGADAGTLAAMLLLLPFAIVVAIATSVPRIPFNVVCTAASCEAESVVFAASDAFNCESVAASVLSVPLKAPIWAAESPLDGVATATAPCEPVPAIDAGMAFGVPASAGGTFPACISRFANVAFAISSCCWSATVCAGMSACVAATVWACAVICPPMLPIATISAAKKSNLFMGNINVNLIIKCNNDGLLKKYRLSKSGRFC